MLDNILYKTKRVIPTRLFRSLQPAYHITMALAAAVVYRFPSKKMKVVAVTGTKGKSSVTEILNAILEEAGYTTALSNTIRFKIGDESANNLYKMSMPGRFFVQRFLRHAALARCDYAVLEVTSQGALLNRHRFISFDALIFTNLAPEHIEAHGSYEKYIDAKLSIADAVSNSKKDTILVVNADDKESHRFLAKKFGEKHLYSLSQALPYKLLKEGFDMTVERTKIHSLLSGEFNISNELAAITYARTQGISMETCKKAIEKFAVIHGRVERIKEGQNFDVVVDYAHTPDSLQKFYDAFKGSRKRICILGNTGGGRDTWKRDEMAKIAERECDEIILTNEDPYDDDPMKIITDMSTALKKKKPRIIMDRREAIAKALSMAKKGDSVLITGKGTDPYIMGPDNTKIPWSDAAVAREELRKIL